MKKILCFVLIAAFMLNGLTTVTFAGTVADNFDYDYETIDWTGNKIVVHGYFYNDNKDYEISNIKNFELSIFDANDKKIVTGSFSDGGAIQKLVIKADSEYDFDLTINNVKADKKKFDLSDCYVTIKCDFTYTKVSAAKPKATPTPAPKVNPSTPQVNPSAPVRTEVRTPCSFGGDGKRDCTSCGGDGKMEVLSGSIWGDRCRTCSGSGRMYCIYCSGKGYTSTYVWK